MEDRRRVCALLGSAIRLALGIVLGCTVFSAGAIPVIDQSQSDTSTLLANFGGSDLLLVQSFKQGNKNIAGAGIFAYLAPGTNPSSGEITIALFGKLPETLGETPLASASGLATQGQWLDLFWKPLDLGEDTHYLVFTGENVRLGLAGATTNPYKEGLMSRGEAQTAPTLALNALSSSIKYTTSACCPCRSPARSPSLPSPSPA